MAVDGNLARSLLTDAKGRYESAYRWSLVTVLTMLLLHVMTVSPFIRAQVDRASVAAEQRTLRTASAELESSLQVQQSVMQEIRDALDAMLVAKKAEFAALQRAVVLTRSSLGLDEFGDTDLAVQDPPFIQAQAPRLQEDPRVDFFMALIRNEGLTEPVGAVSTGNDLRTILRPIIEREIIAPQFAVVNERWLAALPRLKQGAARIEARFAELALAFPDVPLWNEMHSEAESYLAALDAVVFGPPDDPQWWHTVVGKDSAVLQMKEVEVELLSPESFRTANTALQGWLDERDTLIAGLDAQLAELQARFDEQQDRLANLLVPISGVALDLSIGVGHFPLALAILLGVAMTWPEHRRRELRRATTLARRAGLIDEQDGDLFLPRENAPVSRAYTLAAVALSIAWIALASQQLAAWPGREGLGLAVMTTGAVLIAAAAGAYRIRAGDRTVA